MNESPSELPQRTGCDVTWKLILAYDGTEFHGWQAQPGRPTIQGELQAALRRVTGEAPLPQGSGRTDAGVHALGQVASFPLCAAIPPENLRRALNRTLPSSIRVLEAERMQDPAFHARHSAIAKTYEYRIFPVGSCPPFLARYVYAFPWPLNLALLQQAAGMFVGEKDFRSFAATDPDVASRMAEGRGELPREINMHTAVRTSTVRSVFASDWSERQTADGLLLIYRVRGNGFLHHMVRNLVGTMLDVGRGYLGVDEIPRILAERRRAEAGPTAPARGLFLHSVEYKTE
jgi:tRNA pseudouridine38-40 synthase